MMQVLTAEQGKEALQVPVLLKQGAGKCLGHGRSRVQPQRVATKMVIPAPRSAPIDASV